MTTSDASLLDLGIRAIGDGFRRRTWSPVDAEAALSAAAQAERELINGTDRGALHGIPIGIKDIFDVAVWPTRCGSAARDDIAPATANASSVQALIDGGAVILGKTTTQE